MSKIETHEVCTNHDEKHRAPELTHRLMIGKTHLTRHGSWYGHCCSQALENSYLKHSKLLVFRLAREENT